MAKTRIDLSTAGVTLKYAVETTAGTRPTTGYTKFSGLKSTPSLNPQPEAIDATTLDETEYKVTVEVKDVKGELKAEVSYPNGKPEFENKYSAKATSVNLLGKKTLTGKDLEEGMFKFQVIDESGEEVSTGTNDETGKIKFSKINYEKVGSLRIEARQKLELYRPISIGQASRISGVSPADISVLLVYLSSIK